jgi:hypothetical protein
MQNALCGLLGKDLGGGVWIVGNHRNREKRRKEERQKITREYLKIPSQIKCERELERRGVLAPLSCAGVGLSGLRSASGGCIMVVGSCPKRS